jgi:hypothetical protein
MQQQLSSYTCTVSVMVTAMIVVVDNIHSKQYGFPLGLSINNYTIIAPL